MKVFNAYQDWNKPLKGRKEDVAQILLSLCEVTAHKTIVSLDCKGIQVMEESKNSGKFPGTLPNTECRGKSMSKVVKRWCEKKKKWRCPRLLAAPKPEH